MATQSIPRLTEDEYLELDRANETRSEFIDGEMLAMSGGSPRHSVIALRIGTQLNNRLTGRGCSVFNSDMRVRTSGSGAYVYPDLSVVCGEPLFRGKRSDALINPLVVVEVLSPSTADYDRTRKFDLYREIESLGDYLMVDTTTPKVTHFSRQPDSSWVFRETIGLDGNLYIPALSLTLNLSEIYADAMHLPA